MKLRVENWELRVLCSIIAQLTLSSQLSTLNFVNNDSVRPYTVRLHSRLYKRLARE